MLKFRYVTEPLQILLVQAGGLSEAAAQAQLAGQDPPLLVATVGTLAAALAFLEREPCAAILLDLELPGTYEMDGFITLSQHTPAVPILCFAETLKPELALELIRAGAQDFITRAEVESPRVVVAVQFAIERHLVRRAGFSHAEQLQFSEARFRLLINENADAILVVNRAGIIRFANPAAAVLFGQDREALMGSHFEAALEPGATKTIEIARGEVKASAEMRVVETLWSREQVFIATLRDVTEQQRIALALHESQERYREFISSSSEGIWRADFIPPQRRDASVEEQIHAIFHHTFIAECNDAMAQMYGFATADEMRGRVTDLDVPTDDPVNRELFRAFVSSGYRTTEGASHEFDRFGNRKVFQNNIYGIVRGDYLVGMWGTQRDVTANGLVVLELERAEAQEKHQRDLAQALADSAAVLNSTLHYEQVLDRILENVGRVVPHDAASIFLIQDETARLVRGRGFAAGESHSELETLQLPIHEIVGYEYMFTSGKPLVISDTGAYAGWKHLAGDWIQSYVGAPLRVHNVTIGFLNLDSAVRNFFVASHAIDLEAFAAQAATALENARLHTEVRQRADAFAALYDLTRELGMQRDLDTLLHAIVDRAQHLLQAPCGALALYVPETRELQARVVLGQTYTQIDSRIDLGEGLMGRVALLRQPLVLDDYRRWEYRPAWAEGTLISAAVGVPMLFSGELVGVLVMHEQGDVARKFTQADAQLLALLAVQAAALVHNARLHEATEKRAQQMGLLYDAGLTLNSVLDPLTQLDFLTRIAMRSVAAERAVFFRYEPAAGELVLEIVAGFPEGHADWMGARVPLDAPQGIEAWVGRERLPATLNDVRADLRYTSHHDDLASGVWVPIEHDNRLLGVLAVGSTQRSQFSPQDERLLLLFASQAAVALENARLYQHALEANERRTVLHWASQEIVSAGLDAERVYAAIHQATSRLMPCEAFVIALLDDASGQVHLDYLFDRAGRQPVGVIPITRGISGYVITTGEPLLIDNLAESDLDVINFGFPQQVSSLLAVPLRHGGKVVGMMSAQAYHTGAYTPEDRLEFEMLAAHAAAAVMNVRGADDRLRSLEQAYLETVLALAKAIDARDLAIRAHGEWLTDLAGKVARKLELSALEIQTIELAAQLHDIGKIGVPDHILLKPGPLTEDEWRLMRLHTEIGAEILSPIGQFKQVVPLVRHHQERFNGSGYPDGLAGDAIPLGARILAVVDAYSAITEDRVYRAGRSAAEALDELQRCAGTQFDPQVVAVFMQVCAEM